MGSTYGDFGSATKASSVTVTVWPESFRSTYVAVSAPISGHTPFNAPGDSRKSGLVALACSGVPLT
jgi:hypothetical protein